MQNALALSGTAQLEIIRKHAHSVKGLYDRLKYWDDVRAVDVHEALESMNAEINGLGLGPAIEW